MKTKKLAILGLSVALVILTAAGAAIVNQNASADQHNQTVETRGTTDFIPNRIVFSTLSFYPDEIEVMQGDTVSFMFADDDIDPHTATVVTEEEMPRTIEEVFNCEACEAVLDLHFPQAEPEEGAPPPPEDAVKVIDEGEEGFDTAGDSLLFFHGETIETTISAPPGTTLYYVCAIHPWMQGSIVVMDEQEEEEDEDQEDEEEEEPPAPTPTPTP